MLPAGPFSAQRVLTHGDAAIIKRRDRQHLLTNQAGAIA
jgi:hypothetical protein